MGLLGSVFQLVSDSRDQPVTTASFAPVHSLTVVVLNRPVCGRIGAAGAPTFRGMGLLYYEHAFMTSENWELLKDLFEQALACDSPQEQRDFLANNCGENAALRSELESLLVEHSRMSAAFLEQSPAGPLPPSLPREGSLVGAYRLERELGRGGMGTVFLAARADGAYQKQVAIKLVSAAGSSEELARRFLSERQILARLDHPNIARLVDGGTTEQGQPYLVMDYIEGIPIDRYCRERSLDLDQRLELFGRVCAAVAYANQNMVVHRDIKPTNILVTADGVPKLLDFGIAKLLRADPDGSETRTLLLIGTPEYASPEQLSGRAITKSTDVYSLGVLLYELLTDRSPYQLANRAAHEMARVICEEQPDPPSSVITRRPAQRHAGAAGSLPSEEDRKRSKRLRGNLDNIVMMALRKEPEQRYQTVIELAEDIRRHAQGLPVHGRGPTRIYRASKFARGHKPAIGLAALAVIGVITTVEEVWQPRNGRAGETANRRVWAGDAYSVLPDGRMLSLTNSADLTLHDLQTGEDRRLTRNEGLVSSSVFSRDGRWLAYAVESNGENPPPMELRVIGRDGAGQRTVFRDTGQSWLMVQDWTDSQHVLVSSEQDPLTLLLVSIVDGSSRVIPVSSGWAGTRVMTSPDGRYAAYAAGLEASAKTEVRILSLPSGADAPLLPQPADDSVLGWSPDGGRLVFRSKRAGLGTYDIWWVSMANGQAAGIPERFGPSPNLFRSLGVTKQGGLFYGVSNDSDEVFLSDFDAASGQLSPPKVLSGRFAGTKTVPIWSPEGTSVLFVAGDMLHFHNLSNGAERDLKPELADLKRVVAWRPDARTLFESASGSDGKRGLFLIDAESGGARKILEGRMDDVSLSLDGNTLYAQGGPQSRSIVSRNLSTGEERILATRPSRRDFANLRLRLSPDGKMLAMQMYEVATGFNSLAVMPVTGGEPRVLLQVRTPQRFGVGAIAWSPDMRYVYAARCSGLFAFNDHSEILRVPVDGGPAVTVGPPIEGIVRHLSLSRDGRQVLYQSHRTTGEIWALENFLPPAPPATPARR